MPNSSKQTRNRLIITKRMVFSCKIKDVSDKMEVLSDLPLATSLNLTAFD